MAAKVKTPNENQLAILKALTPARALKVTSTEVKGKSKTTVTFVSVKTDKPAAVDVSVTEKTVTAMQDKGWLQSLGGTGAPTTSFHLYGATDEGRAAVKAAAKAAKQKAKAEAGAGE